MTLIFVMDVICTEEAISLFIYCSHNNFADEAYI